MKNQLISLVLVSCAAVDAQDSTARHVSIDTKRQLAPIAKHTLHGIVARLDTNALKPVVSASWEEKILLAATEAVDKPLQLPLRGHAVSGLYTLSLDEGDVLVAHWAPPFEGRKEKSVWLWDTAEYTTVIIEIEPSVIRPSEFPRYCEDLFRWGTGSGIEHRSLTVVYSDSRPGNEQLAGFSDHRQTSTGSWHTRLSAIIVGDSAYIAFGMSKWMWMYTYPSGGLYVKERFPPLRERLPAAPRFSLFDELGKGYRRGPLNHAAFRDEIIVKELISRGSVTEAELRRILTGGPDQSENIIADRMRAILGGVEPRKELSLYAPMLHRILLEQSTPISARLAAAILMRSMELQNIPLGDFALASIEHGRYLDPSFLYLRETVRDEATVRRLSTLTVPPGYERTKQRAVDEIRRRIREAASELK